MADNKDKNFGFSEQEKIALADDILPLFLNKNFGTVQKTEIELVVFHHYLKHCKSLNTSVSDLNVGKQLGITPARVRNMKLKDYLHQDDDDSIWKQELLKQMNETSFEIRGKDILFVIRDVTLMTELRNFLEENGFVNEYSLNPNLFSCSVDVMLKMWAILSGKDPNIVSKTLVDYIDENNKQKLKENSKIFEIFELINPELQEIFPKGSAGVSMVNKVWNYFKELRMKS